MRISLLLPCLLVCAATHAEPAAWRIEGTNGNEVLLLGSVHYLREQDYPLPARIDDLYARADEIVLELDLDDIDALELQSKLLRAAMLPIGERLPDVINEHVYALANQHAGNLGIDLALLERFEPWLVAITMLDLGMSQLGYRADRGIEQYLLRKAGNDGKDIHGLETPEAQVAIFDALNLTEQQALLEQTLDELGSADQAMDAMVGAWRNGDLESLAKSLMSEFDAFPGLYDALVINRNNNWIATLERLLQDGDDYLVVVGALHLVGANSVVDLLRANGHTVTPL